MVAKSSIVFPKEEIYNFFAHLEEALDKSPPEESNPPMEGFLEVKVMVKSLIALSYDQFIHPFVQASISLAVNLFWSKNGLVFNSFAKFADYFCKLAGYVNDFNELIMPLLRPISSSLLMNTFVPIFCHLRKILRQAMLFLAQWKKMIKDTMDSINDASTEIELLNAKIIELTTRRNCLTKSLLVDHLAIKETSWKISFVTL